MNALTPETKLLLAGIGLLDKRASDNGLYGRMARLTGHAIFALGRAGSGTCIDQDLNKVWLRTSEDLERDGLSQTHLREMIIEFKNTKVGYFNAIFAGKSSLLLHKAAREFFRELRMRSLERDKTVCLSLGLACMLLAENRYSAHDRSLQECLEQKQAVQEFARSSNDLVNYLALTADFIDIFNQLENSSASSESNPIVEEKVIYKESCLV